MWARCRFPFKPASRLPGRLFWKAGRCWEGRAPLINTAAVCACVCALGVSWPSCHCVCLSRSYLRETSGLSACLAFDEDITSFLPAVFYLQWELAVTGAPVSCTNVVRSSIHSSFRSKNLFFSEIHYSVPWMERKYERRHNPVSWVLIKTFRISVVASKYFQTALLGDARNKVLISFCYSCYFVIYSRRDCISLDHPACSIEAFQMTVQWAARPFCIQQHTVSRARRTVPMLHHSRKNCNNNNMDFVNDFHIHTEVSSVERGNHLHFARRVYSQRERSGRYGDMFGIFPSPCCFMDGWKDLTGFPTKLPSCCGEYWSLIMEDVKNEGKDENFWAMFSQGLSFSVSVEFE